MIGLILTIFGLVLAVIIWNDQKKKGRLICDLKVESKFIGNQRPRDSVYSNSTGDLDITIKVLIRNNGITPIIIDSILYDLYSVKQNRILTKILGRKKSKVLELRGSDLPLKLNPEASVELFQFGLDFYRNLEETPMTSAWMKILLVDSNLNKYFSNQDRIIISDLPRDRGACLITYI